MGSDLLLVRHGNLGFVGEYQQIRKGHEIGNAFEYPV